MVKINIELFFLCFLFCLEPDTETIEMIQCVRRSNVFTYKLTPDHKADLSILVISLTVLCMSILFSLSPTPYQWLLWKKEGQCEKIEVGE